MSLACPNVCGPLSHLYGRHRARLPREQSGRVVNLFTHLLLVIEFQTCQDLSTANMPHCNRYLSWWSVGCGDLMKIGRRATESGGKGAARTYINTHTHTAHVHTHTYIHTYIHNTYIHTYTHTHTYIHNTHIHT
jgi:hypothetical protein